MSAAKSSPSLIWDSLIAEAQFATELITSGVRHLCTVPLPSDIFIGSEDDAKYPLHVGLHSLTSGLERIAKLSLLVSGRLESGTFPTVRRYSHGLTELYDAVKGIPAGHDPEIAISANFPDTSPGTFGALALDFLTEFASGPGRYSYLDTLGNGTRGSDPYLTWQSLCESSPDPTVRTSLCLWAYEEIESLTYGSGRDDLEIAFGPIFAARPRFMRKSTVTALRIYELVAPVSSILSALAEHAFWHARVPGIPVLGEVVNSVSARPEDFLEWELLHLGDADVIIEILASRADPEAEDDPEDIDDLFEDS